MAKNCKNYVNNRVGILCRHKSYMMLVLKVSGTVTAEHKTE